MKFGFENIKKKVVKSAMIAGAMTGSLDAQAEAPKTMDSVDTKNQLEINAEETLQAKLDSLQTKQDALEKELQKLETSLEIFEKGFYANYESVRGYLAQNNKKSVEQWGQVKDLLSHIEQEIEFMAGKHLDKQLNQEKYKIQLEKNFKNYENNKTGKIVYVLDNVLKGQIGSTSTPQANTLSPDEFLHMYFGKIISEAVDEYTGVSDVKKELTKVTQEKQKVIDQIELGNQTVGLQ